MLINLTPAFAPLGEGIPFTSFTFPSGIEKHFKLEEKTVEKIKYEGETSATFTLRMNSMDDLMLLFLATDAVRRMGVTYISVFFPYLPYARQDRVMDGVEPFSLKVLAKLLNSQNYDRVEFLDVHSDVATALIENSYSRTNEWFIKKVVKELQKKKMNLMPCSPDAGAAKKIYKLLKTLKYNDDVIICNKRRNLATGEIEGADLSINNLRNIDVLIIDDICSRGGTFRGIASVLKEKGAASVTLAVTHYENTADRGVMYKSGIDYIYTTNSLQDLNVGECWRGENKTEITQYNIYDLWPRL